LLLVAGARRYRVDVEYLPMRNVKQVRILTSVTVSSCSTQVLSQQSLEAHHEPGLVVLVDRTEADARRHDEVARGAHLKEVTAVGREAAAVPAPPAASGSGSGFRAPAISPSRGTPATPA